MLKSTYYCVPFWVKTNLAGLEKNGEKFSIRSEVQRFSNLAFKKNLEINVLFSDLRKKIHRKDKNM